MARPAHQVVRAAQAILGVTPDGSWGPVTQAAYDKASGEMRAEVDVLIARDGYTIAALRSATANAKRRNPQGPGINWRTGMARWISETELDGLISVAVQGTNVTPALLKGFVRLEAAQKIQGNQRFFDTQSQSGSFRGLGQMGSAAWSDVQGFKGFNRPYSDVFDPLANLQATARYIEVNERYARAKGYTGPITSNIAYALHNQGAGGFMKLLRGAQVAGKQSTSANKVIAAAISEANRLA